MPTKHLKILQLYRDEAGEHRWRLVASNGKTVADSGEGYRRPGAARKAALAALDLNPADIEYTSGDVIYIRRQYA